jgi:hypothetical protein
VCVLCVVCVSHNSNLFYHPLSQLHRQASKSSIIEDANVPGYGQGYYPNIIFANMGDQGIAVPEIRRFRKTFSSEILCASTWGQNMLIGTKSGLVLLDRTGQGHFYPLITRRKFTQILVMESLGVMLAICGKNNGLRMYYLSYFKAQAQGKSRKGLQLFEKVCGLKGCGHFQATRHQNMRFLAVSTKSNITLLMWAPKPYFKFLLFKDFEVPYPPLLVDTKVNADEDLKIIFASRLGFHSIDVETGNVFHAHLPKAPSGEGIKPLAIIQMPESAPNNMEYLLCFDST